MKLPEWLRELLIHIRVWGQLYGWLLLLIVMATLLEMSKG